jgi:hypothetical protein
LFSAMLAKLAHCNLQNTVFISYTILVTVQNR